MAKTFLQLICVALALASAAARAQTPGCSYDGTGAVIATVGAGAHCNSTPQEYDVTIYRLGLCAANPALAATADFSSCTMLIDGPAQTAHLAAGSSIALAGVSLPRPGTYRYAVLVGGNSIGIMNTQKYSVVMTGSAGGTGTTCWTVAGVKKTDSPAPTLVACGAAAAPAVSIDKLDNFNNGGPGDPTVFGGSFNGLSSTVTVAGGVMFAKLATTSLAAATAADFPDGITRLIAVETFSTPITIDASTAAIDIAFSVTNAANPWITGGAGGTGAGGTIQQFGSGPFSMIITAR